MFVGTFPFNSFLSGFICHVGIFAAGIFTIYDMKKIIILFLQQYDFTNCDYFLFIGASLRLQLTSPEEFKNITPEKAFGGFALCCLGTSFHHYLLS